MRLPGIRLVEQTEQNLPRSRDCHKEKQKKKNKRVTVIVVLFCSESTKNGNAS